MSYHPKADDKLYLGLILWSHAIINAINNSITPATLSCAPLLGGGGRKLTAYTARQLNDYRNSTIVLKLTEWS